MSGHDQPALRRSRRLATIVPASDWIGMGYDPTVAESLERLQRDIEYKCDQCQCRDGASIRQGIRASALDLIGMAGPDGKFSARASVPAVELLLPHWRKLAHAIRGRATAVEIVWIVGISLPPSVLDTILPSLQTCHLRAMDLFWPNMGMQGLLRLSSFIADNSSLVSLRIVDEKFTDIAAVGCFSGAIAAHPSLRSVKLSDCGLNNAEVLSNVIDGCKSLNDVCFMRNYIGSSSDAVAVVGDFISGNQCATTLGLPQNNISDRDTEILAAAMKKNTHLQNIDLCDNNITAAGGKVLIKAFFDTTTLKTLVESNHTCVVDTYKDDYQNPRFMNEMSVTQAEIININGRGDMGERQKIRQKTILALCGEEELFDLGYFNEVSLKLMPRVLELIQEHARLRSDSVSQSTLDRDALSRVYHTLRGWEMPSLFENLQKPLKRSAKRKRNDPRYGQF